MSKTLAKIPLRKSKLPKKYSWEERVTVQKNSAIVKYGRLVDPKPLQAAKSSTEPVTDDSGDIGYFGPITLGGQQFQLLFDTGSSDLWVPQASGNTTKHNTFDPKKSSTFKTDNQPFSITYGKGHTSGIAATDTFEIAGFTVENQAFGLANNISSDFTDAPFDGILGLAFDQLSELKQPTPFQNLVNNDDVTSPVFGFILGREKDGTSNSSELTIGGIDSKFSQNIKFNKVVSKQGFWQIALDGAHVDDNAVEISGTDAIIDTGTTLVIIPPADADAIHNAIPGSSNQSGTYLIPSDTTATVSFTFGGVSYTIKTEDLIVDDAGNGLSVSGIQGSTLPGMENTWLVGDVFLKNVFNAYDVGKTAVGFASLNE